MRNWFYNTKTSMFLNSLSQCVQHMDFVGEEGRSQKGGIKYD